MTQPLDSIGEPNQDGSGVSQNMVILAVVIVAVIAVVGLAIIWGTSGDDESSPVSTTFPPIDGDGDNEGGSTDVTLFETTTTLPPTPPPYADLEVKPIEGCFDSCATGLSYVVTGPDEQRELVLALGEQFIATVTVTNPTPNEYILKSTTTQSSGFQSQIPDANSTTAQCPIVGSKALKIPAESTLVCESTFKYADANYYELDFTVTVGYLFADYGQWEEVETNLPTSDFSFLEIECKPAADATSC